MAKRYIEAVYDTTITSAVTLKALMDTAPENYPIGGMYVIAHTGTGTGLLFIVTANSGTAVTLGTVTVT